MFNRCDPNIMRYIPKKIQTAIKDCWKSDNGYFIILKDGYIAGNIDFCDTKIINEKTIASLKYQISGIRQIVSE